MALPLILLGNSNLLCLNLKVLPLKDTLQSCNFRHKADYLKSLISDQDVVIHAAYGSSKDISVYSSLELKYDQIFVFGKPSKKQSQLQVTWLSNGYAEHLAYLTSPGKYPNKHVL